MMSRLYGIDENEGSLEIQSTGHPMMFLELIQLVELPSCSEVARMMVRWSRRSNMWVWVVPGLVRPLSRYLWLVGQELPG